MKLSHRFASPKVAKINRQFHLDNESFEVKQVCPSNSANQSAPLKKGFAAAATSFTLFPTFTNIKICSCAGERNCLESLSEGLLMLQMAGTLDCRRQHDSKAR